VLIAELQKLMFSFGFYSKKVIK